MTLPTALFPAVVASSVPADAPALAAPAGLSDLSDLSDRSGLPVLADLTSVPGLTATDAERITAALDGNYAPTTVAAYTWTWSHFARWCHTRGLEPLPADPAAVCAYLTDRAAAGLSFGTITMALSAIGYGHHRAGLSSPTDHDAVRQVRRGLRRALGTAATRQARPFSLDDIHQLVASVDRTTRAGARDTAIILLGYASALRVGELAALDLADVTTKPGGLLLTVRGSKTDQDRHGQVVGVAHGRHPHTDPVTALATWLDHRGTAPGRLFTSLRPGAHPMRGVTGDALARMLRQRAQQAGIPAAWVTGHSLRAGHATSAALAGVPAERIAAQTRHRRVDVLIERYIRPIDALRTTSSRDLGL